MINNRQNGRRRGRGGGGGGNGQRPGGGGQGRPDNGNRIDNRARGNASQLLEKYRNLAADAQRQGDRVNTEYYLQFADHYFRVLADQRGRFEEQQPRRQANDFDVDVDGDDEYGDEGEPIRGSEQQMNDAEERQQAPRGDNGQRRERGNWNDRGDRQPRRDRDGGRDGGREPQREEEVAGQRRADPPMAGESLDARAEAVLEADAPLAAPARRRGRPRRDEQPQANGVDADRLPPSFGIAAAAANDADEASAEPKPRRRRTRSPAAETPDAAE